MLSKLYNPCADIETKSLSFIYQGTGPQLIDLIVEKSNGLFEGVKTVYIDNSKNKTPFEFRSIDTGQIVTCPALKQGYFPILTGEVKFSVTPLNAVSSVTVPIQLINYEVSTGVF